MKPLRQQGMETIDSIKPRIKGSVDIGFFNGYRSVGDPIRPDR